MDMHEPYSLEARACPSTSKTPSFIWPTTLLRPPSESIELEAESASGRRNRSAASSGLAVDVDMNANQEQPSKPDGTPGADFATINPHDWHPHYMACLQYFVDQSQHSTPVQSVAAFLNIRLPCQYSSNPVFRLSDAQAKAQAPVSFISLRPYIRRLIVTGHDSPLVLSTLFGENWQAGVGCIFKQERVNYLFTAKSGGWASTKAAYDMLPDEHTPFLRALRDPMEDELREAENRWSEWLAMEDWMVGPRSPW